MRNQVFLKVMVKFHNIELVGIRHMVKFHIMLVASGVQFYKAFKNEMCTSQEAKYKISDCLSSKFSLFMFHNLDFKGACSDPQPHPPNFFQTYGDFGTRS